MTRANGARASSAPATPERPAELAPAPAQAPAAAPAAAAAAAPVPAAPLPPGAAQVPARARRGRLSSKFGTVNYSVDEMRRLNDKVRAVLPVSSEEWVHVAYQFNYLRPDSIPYREVDSLKRKFKKMYCARADADGALPDYLEDAKDLRRLINQRGDKAQSEDAQSEVGAPADDPALDVDVVAAAAVEATAAAAASAGDGQEARPTTMLLPDELQGRPVDQPATQEHMEMAVDEGSIVSKLRQFEEDYHRAIGAASSRQQVPTVDVAAAVPSAAGAHELSAAAPSTSSAASTGLSSPTSASTAVDNPALMPPGGPISTSGIIAMLKQSIERKRRTVEEQALHESARVRRERKKRKMEQALQSIHQEQIEREAAGSTTISTEASAVPSRYPLSPGRAYPSSTPTALAGTTSVASDASSLGLMEIMLHYMTAQQLETARRQELDDERRRLEQLEREERRRQKDLQRRKHHQELMLALNALLGDKFPPSLRHHLEAAGALSEPAGDASTIGTIPQDTSTSADDEDSAVHETTGASVLL